MNWEEIIEEIIKERCNETSTIGDKLHAVYDYVKETYSSLIAGDGYVYFGTLSDGTPIYKIVGNICEMDGGGYITSSEAGKLFNEEKFYNAVIDYFGKHVKKGSLMTGKNQSPLWEGFSVVGDKYADYTGNVSFIDGSEAPALNDAFSEMYVRNLECSNVKTLMFGDFTKDSGKAYNAFCRTEFELLFADESKVKTINGIDKNVFRNVFEAAGGGKEGYQALCDALKASQIDSLKDYY